ncbi:hypothetical protein [Cryobacterium sp. TMT4-31]|uniref:hypothetical protein n=1 Tax=Cryobacterium sp. TMT4-31 TaxID=1259259 RepID=UPI00106AB3AE|nr:hypothetical protein [Cryobacterium sp. TMT4-31]TFC89181.1 hypothetical protein E3T19_08985 [Cryobacterium sp. TMT4-31]
MGVFDLGEHPAHPHELPRLNLARAGQLLDQGLGVEETLLRSQTGLTQLPSGPLGQGLRQPRLAGVELALGLRESALTGQDSGIRQRVVVNAARP